MNSCGHPVECIVSSDEGTAYCRWCALEAENARLTAELKETQEQLRRIGGRWSATIDHNDGLQSQLQAARELIQRAEVVINTLVVTTIPLPEVDVDKLDSEMCAWLIATENAWVHRARKGSDESISYQPND